MLCKLLIKVGENPYLNLLSGVVLLVTGGFEIWEKMDMPTVIGAHHGVVFFGLLQILKTLPELLHGVKELQEGKDALA